MMVSRRDSPRWKSRSRVISPGRFLMHTTNSTRRSMCSTGACWWPVTTTRRKQHQVPCSWRPEGTGTASAIPTPRTFWCWGSGRRQNLPSPSCATSAPLSRLTPRPTPTACVTYTPGTPVACCPDVNDLHIPANLSGAGPRRIRGMRVSQLRNRTRLLSRLPRRRGKYSPHGFRYAIRTRPWARPRTASGGRGSWCVDPDVIDQHRLREDDRAVRLDRGGAADGDIDQQE